MRESIGNKLSSEIWHRICFFWTIILQFQDFSDHMLCNFDFMETTFCFIKTSKPQKNPKHSAQSDKFLIFCCAVLVHYLRQHQLGTHWVTTNSCLASTRRAEIRLGCSTYPCFLLLLPLREDTKFTLKSWFLKINIFQSRNSSASPLFTPIKFIFLRHWFLFQRLRYQVLTSLSTPMVT